MVAVHKKFIGAVKDEWSLYSDRASDYTIGEPIGYGASSSVYTASYQPPHGTPTPVALKVLDLDSLPRRSLQLLQRETTLMSLSKHPNVLRVRGSWVDGHKLYIALRLMNKGSAADVMRYGWPGGMEEDVVRCILRQTLQGLNYLHINDFIHRDVKAANLLIDDDGTVLLGDLGVAADLSEDSSHHMFSTPQSGKTYTITATAVLDRSQAGRTAAPDGYVKSRPKIGKRKSFVGTPCWMAPELIEGKQYDSAADIWSFGITALELAQGRPPRSRESPKDVLLRIIRDKPPTLDRDNGVHKYSRAFKEMVDSCLVKDPYKRPTAEQLLQTPFFKGSKKRSYLINTILKDLPPLTRRQERRAVRHPPTFATVDSWDFTSTLHSPTNSIHHRRRAFEDVASPLMRQDKSEEDFHSEHDNRDLREAHQRHSTSSSSEGNTSTDGADGGISTPPTNPSSFTEPSCPIIPKSEPDTEPLSASQNEGSVKRGFWSRIASNVRRPSSKGLPLSATADNIIENVVDARRVTPHAQSAQARLETNKGPDGSLGTSLMQTQPSRGMAVKSGTVNGASRKPTTSKGSAGTTNGGLLGFGARRNDPEPKTKRPGSRGSILGGMVGGAKNKFSSGS
ncbi:kinase-like protein [Macrolepiota fuliginosa MF-IS2]|uniref:Kinase-like protein n=1 Tax=Macrolepiota fuliginosa MF-IS2 TaxID=1400762 RepID=A0A9P5XMR4_9AGAR|nr:kinase-like protein [Macrolepiota fuliginosa MF-IS2]